MGEGVALGKVKVTPTVVKNVCANQKVPPERWLGPPQDRKKETTIASELICGVSVLSDTTHIRILPTRLYWRLEHDNIPKVYYKSLVPMDTSHSTHQNDKEQVSACQTCLQCR
jgi:hypothetical protein